MGHSKQEDRIRQLSESYLGLPFLSWSTQVATKSGNDDPGDGFWASNDVLLAMWMKESEPGKSAEKTISKREKKVRENLRQAKGSLRKWRGSPGLFEGRPYHLQNDFWERYVPFAENLAVVVLNIVDCEDPQCYVHNPKSVNECVKIAATITSRFFVEFFNSGASIRDLVKFLEEVKWGEEGVSEEQALLGVERYIAFCFWEGKGRELWNGWKDENFQRSFRILTSMKVFGYEPTIEIDNFAVSMATVMHDFLFCEITSTLVLIEKSKILVRQDLNKHFFIPSTNRDLSIYFYISDINNTKNTDSFESIINAGKVIVCLWFVAQLDDFLQAICPPEIEGQSVLHSHLQTLP